MVRFSRFGGNPSSRNEEEDINTDTSEICLTEGSVHRSRSIASVRKVPGIFTRRDGHFFRLGGRDFGEWEARFGHSASTSAEDDPLLPHAGIRFVP